MIKRQTWKQKSKRFTFSTKKPQTNKSAPPFFSASTYLSGIITVHIGLRFSLLWTKVLPGTTVWARVFLKVQCPVPITATAQSQKTHASQSYKDFVLVLLRFWRRLWAKLQGSVRTSLSILHGMYFACKLHTLVQVYFNSFALLYSTTKLCHLLRKMRLLNANIYFKARILNVQWPSNSFQMSWLQTEVVTHTNEYVYMDVLKTSVFLWTRSLPHPSAAPCLPPAAPRNQGISICLTPSKTLSSGCFQEGRASSCKMGCEQEWLQYSKPHPSAAKS